MRHTLVVLLLLLFNVARAQTPTFNNAGEYDAWKATQVIVPTVQNSTATRDASPVAERPIAGTAKGSTATCDCWIAPDASYTTVNNNSMWNASGFNNGDDGSHGPIALPFSFFLYGQTFTTAYININGNVSFGNFYGTFTASGFPVSNFTLVAPFWADVDLRGVAPGANVVQYKVTPTAMYVNWTNVGYYNSQTDKLNTFQLIITDGTDPVIPNGANVSFCYQDMQWTTGSASGGSLGFGGFPAVVGANHGNGIDYIQFGTFDQPGTAYDGPFGMNDGVDWLDDQYFTFSTDITTANVPPVITGQSVCDSLVVCVGELAELEVIFLSPEPNQITNATSMAPTLSNYNIVSNTSGLNAEIITQFTPTAADIGTHIITFEGTDNGVPPLTSTLSIVVEVFPSPTITPGTLDVCSNGPIADLFPELGGNPQAGGTWTGPGGLPHSGMYDPSIDGPGAYTYSVSTGGFCPSSGTVTVSEFDPPDAGVDAVNAYCTSDPVDDLFPYLGPSAQAGGTWTGPNGVFSGMLDPTVDITGQYVYTLTGTAPCVSSSATVDVTVNTAPEPGTPGTLALCKDAPVTDLYPSINGTPDVGGSWKDPAGNGYNGLFDAAADAPGNYTYVVYAMAPCPADSTTVTVTVDPLPNAGIDAGLQICADGQQTNLFNLLGPADLGGTWTDPNLGVHSGSLDPSLEISGPYTYVVDGVGECAALVDSAAVDVVVEPMPIVSFTGDPLAGCDPLDVLFENSTDAVFLTGTCNWSFGDGNTGSGCQQVFHTYNFPGLFDASLTVTTAAGCTTTETYADYVLVEQAPVALFTTTPNPTTVEATTVTMSCPDSNAVAWTWDLGPFGVLIGTPEVTYQFPQDGGGDYQVCLTVRDIYGCEDTECRFVVVKDPLLVYVPNTFTPDGDGNNEVFFPVVSGNDPEVHEFFVFDRWGQVVFKTRDPFEGWNGGKNNSGKLLPTGVYAWRLVTKAVEEVERKEYFGHVTLLK